jgi:hypothetical protein
MSRATPKDRAVVIVRILALLCTVLALMCVGLAWAWTHERETAACWRTAAEFQLLPDSECGT